MRSCRKKTISRSCCSTPNQGELYHEDLAIYSMMTLKECEECEHWAGGDIGYGRKSPPSDGQKLVHISYMLHYTCGP